MSERRGKRGGAKASESRGGRAKRSREQQTPGPEAGEGGAMAGDHSPAADGLPPPKRVRFAEDTNNKGAEEANGGAASKVMDDAEGHKAALKARRTKRLKQAEAQGVQLDKEDEADLEDEGSDKDLDEIGESGAESRPFDPDEWDHGVRLEPFHMRKENRVRAFDAQTRRRRFDTDAEAAEADELEEIEDDDDGQIDPDDEEPEAEGFKVGTGELDPWLAQVRDLGEKSYITSKQKAAKAKERPDETLDKPTLLAQLIDLMQPGETPLQTTKRLENEVKRGEKMKKEPFDRVVALTSGLVDDGDLEAQFATREQLQDMLDQLKPKKGSGASGSVDLFADDSAPAPPTVPLSATAPDSEQQWQYRWAADSTAEVYGPYPTSTMEAWLTAGMFVSNSPEVQVRLVASNSPPWQRLSSVDRFKPFFSSASLY